MCMETEYSQGWDIGFSATEPWVQQLKASSNLEVSLAFHVTGREQNFRFVFCRPPRGFLPRGSLFEQQGSEGRMFGPTPGSAPLWSWAPSPSLAPSSPSATSSHPSGHPLLLLVQSTNPKAMGGAEGTTAQSREQLHV